MNWTPELSPRVGRPLREPPPNVLRRASRMWKVLHPLSYIDLGGTENLLEQRIEVTLPRLPAAYDGMRVGFVSDLHAGPTVRLSFLEDVLERLGEMKCDFVVATGDFIVWEAEPLRKLLPAFRKALGTHGGYFILGNHDYSAPGAVADILERAGWVHLRDRHVDFGEGLRLAGVDDTIYGDGLPDPAYARLQGTGGATLLLMHAPDEFHEVAEEDIGLALCGHTHGGQVRPASGPLWIPCTHGHRWSHGHYRMFNSQLIVTQGVGNVVVRWRHNTRPELLEVVLRSPAVTGDLPEGPRQ